MNKREALIEITTGLNADLVDYRKLKKLLEAQFDAALHHDPDLLAGISEAIAAMAETMEGRQKERVALVRQLCDDAPDASMDQVFRLLADAPRRMFEGWWKELEMLAKECKTINARVCRLLTDQHEIMKRVLGEETHTYAAA